MTLDELTAQLVVAAGEKGKEMAAKYGPTVLSMTNEDLTKWLQYFFVGKYSDAFALYVKALKTDEILAEWSKEHTAWVAANNANAEKAELAEKIAYEFCKAMLSVILAVVVL